VHSEKPSAFYRIVSEMYPRARKVEMFARVVRRGWEQHGAELGKLKRSA
jgi:N6-adenosine-specific RNA methylase IME4